MLATVRYHHFIGRFVDAVTNEALIHALQRGSRQRALEEAVQAFWEEAAPGGEQAVNEPHYGLRKAA